MKNIDMEKRLIIVVIVLFACVWQIHGKAASKLHDKDETRKDAEESNKDGKVRRATNQLALDDNDNENKLGNGQEELKKGKVRRATKRMNKNGRRIAKRTALNDNDKISEKVQGDHKKHDGLIKRASNLLSKIVQRIVKRQAEKVKDVKSTDDKKVKRSAKHAGGHHGGKK